MATSQASHWRQAELSGSRDASALFHMQTAPSSRHAPCSAGLYPVGSISCDAASGCPVKTKQAARDQLPGHRRPGLNESQLVLSSEAGYTPSFWLVNLHHAVLRLCKPESEALQATHGTLTHGLHRSCEVLVALSWPDFNMVMHRQLCHSGRSSQL